MAKEEDLNVWLGFQSGHDQGFLDALFAIQGSIDKLAEAMSQIANHLAEQRRE